MATQLRLVVLMLPGLSVCGMGQPELPQGVLELARIKAHTRQNLSTLPNYTCLETVNRSTRENGALRASDRLRLEVIIAGDRELYAWPGGKKLDRRVTDVVRSGIISDGEFGAHARSIFLNDAAQSTYSGREILGGRPTLKYDYRIAQLFSGWTLRFQGLSEKVAASGSFWVYADSLDLVRIERVAENIPSDLPYASVHSSIQYARIRVGGANPLVPQSAELTVTYANHAEGQNHIEFSQCRSYQTQSTMRLDSGSPAEPSSAAPSLAPTDEIELPANLSLTLALDGAIDSAQAIEGDMIRAIVKSDVKSANRVLVPKGAIATGRIRRLERYSNPRPHFIVGLEFSEVVFEGKRAAFTASLTRIEPVEGLSWVLTTKHGGLPTRNADYGTTRILEGETLRTADLPGVGTFFADSSHFTLRSGFETIWRTVDLRH